ncbi:LysM peptidoglycan-binding domain-containing protein [Candidatus Pristimantibacillus sp. PTI5]|uniref:LysM peptidoglycan-binding domain-containing protein n=1 Tax=Candidatus Pristimantibacillus sp. PTI5 TaxID=3400422 RepID=UPI003B013331
MRIHIVKKGDSLYLIGQKYNVSLEEILKLNPGITNPDAIEVGMKLKIPSGHTGGSGGGMDIMHQHIVKQGDTLWKLSKAWGVPLASMIKANPQLKNPNVLLTGEVVNIPKVNAMDDDAGGHDAGHSAGQGTGHGTAQGTGGAHMLHPTSIMQGVQGWVGKLSTAPIIGKTPTGPIAGKTPTAPIAPTPVAPVEPAPVAPVQEKKPTAPVQEKKPTAPVQENKPTAPIVKPAAPAPLPAPKAAAVEPAKKALPIEKPVEKKLKPIHSEYKPNVDLFKQYGIPATEALSLYDLPKAPEAVSPAAQQPAYGGYGYGQPMTLPAQTGHGYGQPMTLPAQMDHGYGYGSWQQPVPFGSTVSPLGEGNEAPFDCPPGTVFVGSYPSPSTMPLGAGPDWGYGHPGINPLQHDMNENNHMVAGALAQPNQGMVSPLMAQPNQGMVSPLMAQPNQGMVSPLMAQPNQGMVSPLMAQPNQGMVSPLMAQPNQGMVSPLMAQPNQGMVSPLMAQPNQGMVSPLMAQPNQGMVSPFMAQPNQGMVSPAGMEPDYGYGYGYGHGGHGMVMPAQAHHDGGYGYGYPAYPPYPGWPQTAGAGQGNQDDCGCKGNRSDQVSAKLADVEIEKPAKTVVQRKNAKKAVIRTVATRSNKTKNRGNQPWINR